MGISLSILLIAVGAVLAWAVTAEVSGVDITAVGIILLIVGIIGLLVSLVFWSSWGGFGGARERRRSEHDHRRARQQRLTEHGHHRLDRPRAPRRPDREGDHARRGASGVIITTVLGIVGALLGGFLATALGLGDPIDEFFDI